MLSKELIGIKWDQYWRSTTTPWIPHKLSIDSQSCLEIGPGIEPTLSHTPPTIYDIMDVSKFAGHQSKFNYIWGLFPIDTSTRKYDTIILHDIFQETDLEFMELTLREIRDLLLPSGHVFIETKAFNKKIALRYFERSGSIRKRFMKQYIILKKKDQCANNLP